LPLYGALIAEVSSENAADFEKALGAKAIFLGTTTEERKISVKKSVIDLEEALAKWENTLSVVFPPIAKDADKKTEKLPDFATAEHQSLIDARKNIPNVMPSKAKPKVLLPVFPGTNCEFDMARAFALSGADTKILVFRNNTPQALEESLQALQAELSTAQILALSGGFSAGDEPDGSAKFICNVLRESRIADGVMNLVDNKKGLVLGICNGFQALIKVGLLPYGKILSPSEEMPTLTYNCINRHISRVVRTRMVSATSPWANDPTILEAKTHLVPISHGEGRIIISDELAKDLFAKGQVYTQYVTEEGVPVMSEPDNPNGSMFAIEGITSLDGRILGKMGHSERTIGALANGKSDSLLKNISGDNCQNLFAAGVRYFN